VLRIACLVALVVVPAAVATPPPHFRVIFPRQVIQVPQQTARQHSCTAGTPSSRVRLPGPKPIADVARKAVVACEQPPRAKLNTATGGVFGSFHH
jgi:hypothetical protein